ncbi:hypothetical protein R3P38DRAFT_3596168, partial [Favolaschia claudopus]
FSSSTTIISFVLPAFRTHKHSDFTSLSFYQHPARRLILPLGFLRPCPTRSFTMHPPALETPESESSRLSDPPYHQSMNHLQPQPSSPNITGLLILCRYSQLTTLYPCLILGLPSPTSNLSRYSFDSPVPKPVIFLSVTSPLPNPSPVPHDFSTFVDNLVLLSSFESSIHALTRHLRLQFTFTLGIAQAFAPNFSRHHSSGIHPRHFTFSIQS